MTSIQKIAPFLWFNGDMEEALKLYTSILPDSQITSMSPMTASFRLCGVEFMVLNAPSDRKFTEAVSLFVKCADQQEVDRYWNAFLAAGATESQCGWLKDRFGLSWQIIPEALGSYLSSPDRDKANRVMQAMLKMKKIIVADLDRAAA
jgi:predicted 3-demethylubiquinone-9 3-methyltransferase (glyoxalase superfamily)